MALDKIRLLVNKIRRVMDHNEGGVNDDKLDSLYEDLDAEIDASNVKLKVIVTTEIEVEAKELDKEWLTDRLIESETDEPIQDIIIEDIVRGDGVEYYQNNFETSSSIKIIDENGKELSY